jgi:hypothetical protein
MYRLSAALVLFALHRAEGFLVLKLGEVLEEKFQDRFRLDLSGHTIGSESGNA